VELYLFRHGIAEDGQPGKPDSERALTDDGRRKAAEVAKMARKAGVKPSLIISSPYIRAAETARVAVEELRYEGTVIETAALVPHGSPDAVWQELREHRDEPAILLSGHEPLLSHLVSHLLASPALRVGMKKAAMVRIDVEGFGAVPHGQLRWMITPKLAG
jgi:phosphohistidine phosphatase